jgi:hypothetical protein
VQQSCLTIQKASKVLKQRRQQSFSLERGTTSGNQRQYWNTFGYDILINAGRHSTELSLCCIVSGFRHFKRSAIPRIFEDAISQRHLDWRTKVTRFCAARHRSNFYGGVPKTQSRSQTILALLPRRSGSQLKLLPDTLHRGFGSFSASLGAQV